MKHICKLCFLQLYRVPSPVTKDQVVCFTAAWYQNSVDWYQNSVELPQCDETMDVNPRKWNTELTCLLISYVYLMLASPENASFLCLMRGI